MKYLFALLLFSLPFYLIAQEFNEMPKIPRGIQEAEPTFISANGGEVTNSRIEPPFWWVGMKNDQLQLMLYGEAISQYTAALENSEVSLQ